MGTEAPGALGPPSAAMTLLEGMQGSDMGPADTESGQKVCNLRWKGGDGGWGSLGGKDGMARSCMAELVGGLGVSQTFSGVDGPCRRADGS